MEKFMPPFCARLDCPAHFPEPDSPYVDFVPWGSYETKAFGKVLRFRCTRCGKTFSVQTFRLDYYAKKALAYEDILRRLASSESLRSIGHALDASPASVSNRLRRVDRQVRKLDGPRAAKPDGGWEGAARRGRALLVRN
jgi:transposase